MTLRVLIVCTANVCRSPMVAALLAYHCEQRGVDAIVRSGGTDATDLPVDPLAVEALAEYGLDISNHQPRWLVRKLVETEGADLILTMTREHLRVAATMATGVFRRTFTAREFVRRISTQEPAAGMGLDSWLKVTAGERRASDLMGDDPIDDIADPYGASLATHHLCASELNQLTDTIAHTLENLQVRSQPDRGQTR